MTDNRTETWREIKSGIGFVFKALIYSSLGLGLFFGAGYVYFTCCK